MIDSGNAIAVRYAAGKPPVMEVRVQELFGWRETPRVAKGRVAIRLHLLGPNGQPQQITDDLENFWNRTYHEVRKELRGRYPKHHWPEDPLEARATRNGLKPKRAKWMPAKRASEADRISRGGAESQRTERLGIVRISCWLSDLRVSASLRAVPVLAE